MENNGSVAGTDSSLKEIQDFLEKEDTASNKHSSWKKVIQKFNFHRTTFFIKYARLVLPHVGLVTFVCIYAIVGAWIFYSLESPHEDRVRYFRPI